MNRKTFLWTACAVVAGALGAWLVRRMFPRLITTVTGWVPSLY